MENRTARNFKEGPGIVELWAGLLVGPIAALTQLEANYALVLWACSARHDWALHLVSAVALLLSTAAATIAYRNFRRTKIADDGGAGVLARSRFMAAMGTVISCLMSVLIIAQWLPVFIYGSCLR